MECAFLRCYFLIFHTIRLLLGAAVYRALCCASRLEHKAQGRVLCGSGNLGHLKDLFHFDRVKSFGVSGEAARLSSR